MIVTVYGTTTCVDSGRLRSWLDDKGVDYTGLLIDKNPHAASRLMQFKDDNCTPFTTVELEDGSLEAFTGYCPVKIELAIAKVS